MLYIVFFFAWLSKIKIYKNKKTEKNLLLFGFLVAGPRIELGTS